MTSLALGQYREGQLVYKGHVTLGVGGDSFHKIRALPTTAAPPFAIPPGSENAVWVEPSLVCTVQYMMKTETGGLRQPVFKGLRLDKAPRDCTTWSRMQATSCAREWTSTARSAKSLQMNTAAYSSICRRCSANTALFGIRLILRGTVCIRTRSAQRSLHWSG